MNITRKIFTTALMLFFALSLFAQQEDPVLIKVNGKDVHRSEFEYALNKNNVALGDNKKAVEEYLPMYVDFKLKVAEAEAMKLDTLSSFLSEYKNNRAQLAESYLIDLDFIENAAHSVYAQDSAVIGPDGIVSVQHIFFPLRQDASEQDIAAAKESIENAYKFLKDGGDFSEAIKRFKAHPGGSQIAEVIRGQIYKEFEDALFSISDGEYSAPFRSPAGYHIANRVASRPFGTYSEYREAIIKMLEQHHNIRGEARRHRGLQLATAMGGNISPEEALRIEDSSLETKYPEFGHLMREYYDGLLFFEVCTRCVWSKASDDVAGIEKFFKKNKKNYKFETPRFRGAVIYANNDEDMQRAKKVLASASTTDEYKALLKENFYVDSAYTVRLEVGVFSIGDNGWVDKYIFEQGEGGKMKRGFSQAGVVGKVIKKPESYKDVRGAVVSDYQKYLEEKWVKSLRKKYKWSVDREVLKTVNNHD